MTNETQTVTQAVKILRALQTAHSELLELDHLLEQKPAALGTARARLGQSREAVAGSHQDARQFQFDIDKCELELAAGEAQIAKLAAQQNLAKTNREYRTFQEEIDGIRAENSRIEDRILEVMTAIEEGSAEQSRAEGNVAEEERRLADAEREIAGEMAQIQAERDEVKARHEELLGQLAPRFLEPYQRLCRARDGLALVPVNNGICGGCFISLPAQAINMLIGQNGLVFCHSCGRILYLAEQTA